MYTYGSEDSYRDFFFPVYNSDTDSNETGAPILRSKLYFHVDGNHDLGSTESRRIFWPAIRRRSLPGISAEAMHCLTLLIFIFRRTDRRDLTFL